MTLKLGKIIFKKIHGRVIPIRVSEKTLRRKALRKQASARTNLSNKRFKALRAVTLSLRGKTKHIGRGMSADVFSAGKFVVKIANEGSFTKRQTAKEFLDRFMIKKKLGSKIAPEVFLVKTKKQSFLVQDKGEIVENIAARASEAGKYGKTVDNFMERSARLINRALRKKVQPHDISIDNLMISKGRLKVSDTGQFTDLTGYRPRDIPATRSVAWKPISKKKLDKFIIRQKK